MRRRLIVLILAVCAMLLATGGAVATTGAERFVMGTHGPNDLRGGSGADLLASGFRRSLGCLPGGYRIGHCTRSWRQRLHRHG